MGFKVPKEIDLEDKIVWFLTMRQLVICLVGFGIGYFAHQNLDGYTWPIVVGIDGLLAFAFAFVRIQDMTFFQFLLSAIGYFSLPHERVWRQHADQFHLPKVVKKIAADPLGDKRLRDRKNLGGLRELALRLDHGASDPVAARAPTADEVEKVFDKIRRPDPAEIRARVEKMRAQPAAPEPAPAEEKSPAPVPEKPQKTVVSSEAVGRVEKPAGGNSGQISPLAPLGRNDEKKKVFAPATKNFPEKKSADPAIEKPAQTFQKSPEPAVQKLAETFQKTSPGPEKTAPAPVQKSAAPAAQKSTPALEKPAPSGGLRPGETVTF